MSLQPPSTPGTKQNAGIKDSLAALRSILMIDTPTKALLDGNHPSVSTQYQSKHEASRLQQMEIEEWKTKTIDLRTRVAEAKNEASKESRMRKSLESTYEALSKHKQELSVQLELVTKSREATEAKLEAVTKTLRTERIAVAQERVQWKPEMERLQREKQRLLVQHKSLESRCRIAERKVKDLERQLQRGHTSLPPSTQNSVTGGVSDSGLKSLLDKAEASRIQAEEISAKSVGELAVIKRRHIKSLDSLLQKQDKLKDQLQTVENQKKELTEKLKSADSGNAAAVLEENQALKEQVQKLGAELEDSTQSQSKLVRELEKARGDIQKLSSEKLKLSLSVQDSIDAMESHGSMSSREMSSDGVFGSLVDLDDLISLAVDSDHDGSNLQFVQKLARVAKSIKNEMRDIQAAKSDAESFLQVSKTAHDRASIDLASSREKLREANDELADWKEEAEELKAKISSLESQLEQRGSDKRPIEMEASALAIADPTAKRQKTDDHGDETNI